MTDKIVIFSTCPSAEEAEKVARGLVEKRLAACVTLIPGARSIYRWKGTVEEAGEYVLIIKSRRDLFARLMEELAAIHSYEVPEILALPVVEGAPAYIDWIDKELKDTAE
jgi:periplasmic divalent cation tolerance protein